MGTEIERKFLVDLSLWRPRDAGVQYRQGYLSSVKERVVRVRVAGEQGFLTIKGANVGLVRAEFEYPIPLADAEAMLSSLCERPLIEKRRHTEVHDGVTWEIDVFAGENSGLVVAEVELRDAQEQVTLPAWVGREVSGDPRYLNSNLLQHPYSRWSSTS